MANSLYNQLNQTQMTTPANNQPKATINSILDEVRQSGMTAQELFYKKASEAGINPQSILSQIPINYR